MESLRTRCNIWNKLLAVLAKDQKLVQYLGAPITSAVFNDMFIMDRKVGELNGIYGHLAERTLSLGSS